MPSHATVLFVEDNEDLRKNAALVLDLEGYAVRLASDGQAALEMLEQGLVPDLIVSDIMMPRVDGYGLFEAVQQMPHLRGIPFIFLTARGSRQDITAGRQLGVDDYLVKPFDPEDFIATVENKLRRSRDMHALAAHRLDNARSLLVQVLSHELRTPITYVTGGFALLAEELNAQKDTLNQQGIEVSLNLIQNGTQRLNRLAEQTVVYTQIISGAAAQHVAEAGEPLELEALIYDAQAAHRRLIEERGIVIRESSTEPAPIVVMGLKDLLVMAFGEILRNAIQYAPAGGHIDIRLGTEDGVAVLAICDDGPGIPLEDQATIWEVLVQSNRETNEQQGAGIGLPIARGIVEAHRGSIALESAPGRGTEVTFRLPLADLPPG